MEIDSSCHPCLILTNSNQSIWTLSVWGMPLYLAVIIICILLLISGLYSASENAFSNCNKYHFQSLANKGDRTSKLITRLVDHFDNTLITILVGNNIIQTLMSFLSAIIFYNICTAFSIGGLESILSTVVMGVLVYLISDTVPKILSKAMPNKMAKFLAYPICFTEIILFPVIFIFRMVLKLVHKLFKIKDENLLTKEDILYSVDEAINDETPIEQDEDENEERLFEKDEKVIVNNIFNFDKKKVEKVYTPKEKVFSLNVKSLTIEKVNEAISKHPYSRIPVFENRKSNIIGILIVKNYCEEFIKDPHLNIQSILEKPIYIDINEEVDDAFQIMNNEMVHLAIVVKDNVYQGIISMQDTLEELVQDIDETPLEQKKGK